MEKELVKWKWKDRISHSGTGPVAIALEAEQKDAIRASSWIHRTLIPTPGNTYLTKSMNLPLFWRSIIMTYQFFPGADTSNCK